MPQGRLDTIFPCRVSIWNRCIRHALDSLRYGNHSASQIGHDSQRLRTILLDSKAHFGVVRDHLCCKIEKATCWNDGIGGELGDPPDLLQRVVIGDLPIRDSIASARVVELDPILTSSGSADTSLSTGRRRQRRRQHRHRHRRPHPHQRPHPRRRPHHDPGVLPSLAQPRQATTARRKEA